MGMEDFSPGSYYAQTVGNEDIVIRFTDAIFVHQSEDADALDFKLGPLTLALKTVSTGDFSIFFSS